MQDIDEVLSRLAKSPFRKRFGLRGEERAYLADKGLPTVLTHGRDLITKRLAVAHPPRDGKQTPFRGHPVFVAQHATATCCRGCLAKWHGIPKGRPLSAPETDYVLAVISRWLRGHGADDAEPGPPRLL